MTASRNGIGLIGALAVALALFAAAPAGAKMVPAGGTVTVGTVGCGAAPCAVATPKRVKLRIGGDRFWARVLAPKAIPAQGSARVRVKLGTGALQRLAGRVAKVRVRVVLRADGSKDVRRLRSSLRRKASAGETGTGGPKSGGPKAGGPVAGPIVSEPPLLARPATAVDVSAVKVSWHPRDSWVRYASSGVAAGDGILTSNGAVGINSTSSPCPDRPSDSDAQLPYTIDFAAKPSWYDPVSGAAGIYGQGSVAFKWKAHTIDLTASDPEIEIAGPASRAIFRFSGSGGTPYPNQRAALVGLDTVGKPSVSNGGKTLTYSLMRGTLTADGVNVFAGFYTPPENDEFGCVSVAFTTP
jgi:hypothetical protein